MVKIDGKWEMIIYYHRNRASFRSEENSLIIKHYKNSNVLETIARKISEQVDKKLDDILKTLKVLAYSEQ